MNERNASEIARQLAAMRRRSTRPCAVCGQPMPEAYGKRRYCSTACHHKAAYQRMKQRQPTAPPRGDPPAAADKVRLRELRQLATLTEQQLAELRRLERGGAGR